MNEALNYYRIKAQEQIKDFNVEQGTVVEEIIIEKSTGT